MVQERWTSRYLLATLSLAVKVRWPVWTTIGTLLAGAIPLCILPQTRPVAQQGKTQNLSKAERQPDSNLTLTALVLQYFPVFGVPRLRTIKVHLTRSTRRSRWIHSAPRSVGPAPPNDPPAGRLSLWPKNAPTQRHTATRGHYADTKFAHIVLQSRQLPGGAGLAAEGSRCSHRLRERVHLRDNIRRGAPQARHRAIAAASPAQLPHGQFEFPPRWLYTTMVCAPSPRRCS
jgi:hypothetical protein